MENREVDDISMSCITQPYNRTVVTERDAAEENEPSKFNSSEDRYSSLICIEFIGIIIKINGPSSSEALTFPQTSPAPRVHSRAYCSVGNKSYVADNGVRLGRLAGLG
ncbi:hypothetical protein KGM_209951 [Danaus plexippus plexippus]|uniref:Uncharacterized protein n=1 Tax=Danaus plexippus plexippus TaxID=278856 RepID=A0A212FHT1_DANPL|nr:hypothetical protein KGM_209951 [Danaus plexippus plexippus]